MISVYDDRGFIWRSWLSTVILVVAVFWGIAELVRAQMGVSDSTGYLFGAGFIAAAAYGGYRMLADARDQIVRLAVDFDSGQAVVTQWRPWALQRLETTLDQLTGWRMFVAIKKRNQPTYLLRVNYPARPRPLHIELLPTLKAVDGLRRLAPEAIEEFEVRTGRRRAS